jgi:tetratricopeptide (TPR) repeat protein
MFSVDTLHTFTKTVIRMNTMIPDEFSMPQARPPVRRGKSELRHVGGLLRKRYRPWVLRCGILVLLVVLGFVCRGVIEASGIKARVLAGIAGACSENTGASSLLKEHRGASAKSRSSVAICEELVRLKPADMDGRVLLGNAYAEVGRAQESVASYQEALALDPNCFGAHLGMGKAYFDRGLYADAVASYRRALKIRPGSADAHLSLGLVLSNAGKYEEAMQAFQKAKDLDPAIVETQILTGKTYLQVGMCAQAIECFKDAVQTDHGHAQAYFNLGRAYLRVGDKGLALEQQHILQDLDPGLANQLLALINQ